MAGKSMSAAGHFGRQMRKERLAHGWTLPEFSTRVGFDAGHLSRVENGKRPPTGALARACDTVFPERRGWFLDWYEESRQRQWFRHRGRRRIRRARDRRLRLSRGGNRLHNRAAVR